MDRNYTKFVKYKTNLKLEIILEIEDYNNFCTLALFVSIVNFQSQVGSLHALSPTIFVVNMPPTNFDSKIVVADDLDLENLKQLMKKLRV